MMLNKKKNAYNVKLFPGYGRENSVCNGVVFLIFYMIKVLGMMNDKDKQDHFHFKPA